MLYYAAVNIVVALEFGAVCYQVSERIIREHARLCIAPRVLNGKHDSRRRRELLLAYTYELSYLHRDAIREKCANRSFQRLTPPPEGYARENNFADKREFQALMTRSNVNS